MTQPPSDQPADSRPVHPQPGYEPAGYEPAGYGPAGYGPAGYEPAGYAPPPAGQPGYAPSSDGAPVDVPAGRRRRVVVGVLVAVLVLLLAGAAGAAFLLTRDNAKGQATPSAAFDGFLTAAYTDRDTTKALRYVCPDARDTAKLSGKISDIKKQSDGYQGTRYSWSNPRTEQTRKDEAILTTTVTLRTNDEQKATQDLRFVMTQHNGWWVCEIQQTG